MKRSEILLVIAAMLFCTGFARSQTIPGPKNSEQLAATDLNRIKVGDKSPDFTLEDENGRPVTLSSYSGKKTVVLVFYRGYW